MREWTKEEPSKSSEIFQVQTEWGEYKFQLAQIDKLNGSTLIDTKVLLGKKELPLMLLFYFLWNFYFAAAVNRKGALA